MFTSCSVIRGWRHRDRTPFQPSVTTTKLSVFPMKKFEDRSRSSRSSRLWSVSCLFFGTSNDLSRSAWDWSCLLQILVKSILKHKSFKNPFTSRAHTHLNVTGRSHSVPGPNLKVTGDWCGQPAPQGRYTPCHYVLPLTVNAYLGKMNSNALLLFLSFLEY